MQSLRSGTLPYFKAVAECVHLLHNSLVPEALNIFIDSLTTRFETDSFWTQTRIALCFIGIQNIHATYKARDDVQTLLAENSLTIFNVLYEAALEHSEDIYFDKSAQWTRRAATFFNVLDILCKDGDKAPSRFMQENKRSNVVFRKVVRVWLRLGLKGGLADDSYVAYQASSSVFSLFLERKLPPKDLDIFGEEADGKLDQVAELALSSISRELEKRDKHLMLMLKKHVGLLTMFTVIKGHPMVLSFARKGAIPVICQVYLLAGDKPVNDDSDYGFSLCGICNAFLHDIMNSFDSVPYIIQLIESGYLEALAKHSRGFQFESESLHNFIKHPIVNILPCYMVYPDVLAAMAKALNPIATKELQNSLAKSLLKNEWRAFMTLVLERLVFKAYYDNLTKEHGVRMQCSNVSRRMLHSVSN